MTTALVRQPTTARSGLEPWVRSLKDAMRWSDGKPTLPRMLTPSERQGIEATAEAIRQRLSPSAGEAQAIAVHLARMLAAFPQAQGDGSLRMEAYFTALDGLPAWAIGEACVAAIRGEGPGDGRFAPTPAELARMTKAAMTDMRADLVGLERLLKAETEDAGPSPAERARVAEGLASLASGIKPERERRAVSADLDTSYLVDRHWRALGMEPDPWCSPSLVALTKRQARESGAVSDADDAQEPGLGI